MARNPVQGEAEPEPPLWEQKEFLRDGERLQKTLARVGLGSRRVCEELIADGRVSVNGEIAILGRRVDVEHDVVAVDGIPIGVRPDLVYYLVNKPRGVVSTSKDTHGRPTVLEMVPREPRVFSVGRLDQDTEGLIILTNDGEFSHSLMHPSKGVEKEYLVHVETAGRPLSAQALNSLRHGVELDDGRTAPASVSELQPGVLRMVIHEGRNRQIRRMCESIGHEVTQLVRVRIGNLRDQRLKPGTFRPLTHDEVRSLMVLSGGAAQHAPDARDDLPNENSPEDH